MTRLGYVSLRDLTLALVVLLWLGTASAQAGAQEDNGLRLTWERSPEASSCPDTPSIEADVVRRLGSNPFKPDAPRSLDVRVSRENGAWRAVIEVRTAEGTLAGSRVVTSGAESCDSLAAAAALGIALVVRTSTPPPPAAPVPAPRPPAPVAAPRKAPAEVLPRDDGSHAVVFVAATGAWNVLPKTAAGWSLIGHVPLTEHLSVVASATLLPEVQTSSELGTYAFGAAWGGLGACYAASVGERVSVAGCASIDLGSLQVVVFDPKPVGPGARLWGASAIGPRLDWNPGGIFHALFGVDLVVPFARRSFDVKRPGGSATVFEQPPVGALLHVGLGVEP